VQGRPALVVPSIDVSPSGHEELHHFQVVVDASLQRKDVLSSLCT